MYNKFNSYTTYFIRYNIIITYGQLLKIEKVTCGFAIGIYGTKFGWVLRHPSQLILVPTYKRVTYFMSVNRYVFKCYIDNDNFTNALEKSKI